MKPFQKILDEYETQDIFKAFFELIGRDADSARYYTGVLAKACNHFVEAGILTHPFDDEEMHDLEAMGWELGEVYEELED